MIDVFVRDTCLGKVLDCTSSTIRVSVASDGAQGNQNSFFQAINSDGRFVAFHSFATNLVPDDTNFEPDVFVRDSCIGAPVGCSPSTTRVSVATDGSQADGRDDGFPSITGDARFVAFTSFATNLVPQDTNERADIFVRDTCVNGPPGCTPATTRVSVAIDGAQAENGSFQHAISGDGRYVAFFSLARNLVPGMPFPNHIYLRETCEGAPEDCIPNTFLLSIAQDGNHGNGVSDLPAFSADGRFVVFRSTSTNLVPGGSNGNLQVFLARTGF